MKISLDVDHTGKWRADVVLPDGRDFHAVADQPWKALIELGIFWSDQPPPSDMRTLGRILLDKK